MWTDRVKIVSSTITPLQKTNINQEGQAKLSRKDSSKQYNGTVYVSLGYSYCGFETRGFICSSERIADILSLPISKVKAALHDSSSDCQPLSFKKTSC
jgi:hypothetical protein